MTVRVDTLEAILTGSPSRLLPALRSLSAASERLATWWQRRSTLAMSDEWLNEYRWSNRDRQ